MRKDENEKVSFIRRSPRSQSIAGLGPMNEIPEDPELISLLRNYAPQAPLSLENRIMSSYRQQMSQVHATVSRTFYWTWRVAVIATFGTMLLFAAMRLSHYQSATAPKPAVVSPDLEGAGRNLRGPAAPSTRPQPAEQSPITQQAETKPPGDTSAMTGFVQSCQCSPSAEILQIIDKAWIVDQNLSQLRAREVISERLYNLAEGNGDDFFLRKASFEAWAHPFRMPDDVIQRYRTRLAQRPGDPVSNYFYAHSLLGKDTPELIRLMRQLISEHPEFPWPNLVLAEVHGYFGNKEQDKVQTYLQAFMKLCPDSPEPTRLLHLLGNSSFLADAVRRMRGVLAGHSDARSLVLYQDLWYLEVVKQATGDRTVQVQQRIKEDLKRLQSLDVERLSDFNWVFRSGYRLIGDNETFRDLFEKDTSTDGRWGAVMLGMRDWDTQNPVPTDAATAEQRANYWERRLRISDAWAKKIPEIPSIWLIKLQALAALQNRSESEILAIGTKVLELERGGAETVGLGKWRSNYLKLASLYADRGVRLDQVPALITEGLAAAEKHYLETSNDLQPVSGQWALLLNRYPYWLEADDAWYALVAAYLRLGKPDKAHETLAYIEAGLVERKQQLAQAQAGAKADDSSITVAQRQRMATELAASEERYAEALARVTQAAKK